MLREAPKTVVANGYLKALSSAGNVVANEVEHKCPTKKEDVGGLLERGELRENIMLAVEIDSQYRGGIATVGFRTRAAAAVALWVEWGHRMVVRGGTYIDNRGKVRKGTHLKDIPAYPFMRPAADVSADKAIDAFAQSLTQTVRENFPQGTRP